MNQSPMPPISPNTPPSDNTSTTHSRTECKKARMTDSAHLLLALDYGVKKMGVALGNTVSNDARPFDILSMSNGQPDWDNLIGIIDKWKVTLVVVGLPLNMDDSASMLSKRAHKFARRLAHRLSEAHLPAEVVLFDERLSSNEARQLAWEHGMIRHEREPIDDIAAYLLLTNYLANPEAATPLNS